MEKHVYEVAVPLLPEAELEARRLGHAFIAPEHLLIAVAGHTTGAAHDVLEETGLDAASLRNVVGALVGRPHTTTAASQGALTLAFRTQVALAEAIRLGAASSDVEDAYAAEDLLAALFSDPVADHAGVGEILAQCGMTPAIARERLRERRTTRA